MKNDIIINVDSETGMIYKTQSVLGIDNENLQNNIVVNFMEDFVDGVAWLELERDEEKGYLAMSKTKYVLDDVEKDVYILPVKSSLLKKIGRIDFQIRITEEENVDGIPVFKSNIFYLEVKKAINSTEEIPDEYPSWIEIADSKINEINNALEEVDNLNISASKTDNIATIEITKKDGTTQEVQILDGADGKDGAKGIDGKDGQDGYTPIKGVDYFDGAKGDKGDKGDTGERGPKGEQGQKGESRITVFEIENGDLIATSENEENLENYSIENGDLYLNIEGQELNLGKVVGTDGHTPVKGVDYWTPSDKQSMVNDTLDSVNSILESYSLISETGNKINLTIDSNTYVLTFELLNKTGNVLSTKTIDLPLETMVVNATFDEETKSIVLTLQNGTTVSFSVASLVNGLISEEDFGNTIELINESIESINGSIEAANDLIEENTQAIEAVEGKINAYVVSTIGPSMIAEDLEKIRTMWDNYLLGKRDEICINANNGSIFRIQKIEDEKLIIIEINYSQTKEHSNYNRCTYIGKTNVDRYYFKRNLDNTVSYNSRSNATNPNGYASVLVTDYNYPNAYVPQYNGSPATKKYVDDSVNGLASEEYVNSLIGNINTELSSIVGEVEE